MYINEEKGLITSKLKRVLVRKRRLNKSLEFFEGKKKKVPGRRRYEDGKMEVRK